MKWGKRLADHCFVAEKFFCKCAVRFQHKLDGFLKIDTGFLNGVSLHVRAGQLPDERNVPFRRLLEYRCELFLHFVNLLTLSSIKVELLTLRVCESRPWSGLQEPTHGLAEKRGERRDVA
jgi:hypothetical protein